MWSMMSLREQALRVPLMIRDAPRDQRRRQFVPIYGHPVELIDIYPTVVYGNLDTRIGSFGLLFSRGVRGPHAEYAPCGVF